MTVATVAPTPPKVGIKARLRKMLSAATAPIYCTFLCIWFCVIRIAPTLSVKKRIGAANDKIMSNIEEVRSRGGSVIAVATHGDRDIARVAEHVLYVPDTVEPLQPLLTSIPLQLIAYHAAVLRGCNVDKPRNLAKSVTVE